MSEKPFLMRYYDQFDPKSYFEKKSCQICPKIVKILKVPDFLNFTSHKWSAAGIGRQSSQNLSFASKSLQNYFCVPDPKIYENIPKTITPKKNFFGGGGDFIKCRFRQV